MSWISLFPKNDFAQFSERYVRRNTIYWRESFTMERLDMLHENGERKKWFAASRHAIREYMCKFSAGRSMPPIASNHLNAIMNTLFEVDDLRFRNYELLDQDMTACWSDWRGFREAALAEEAVIEKRMLKRLIDLTDTEDADVKLGVLIYKILDLFYILTEKIADRSGMENPLAFLKNANPPTSVEKAKVDLLRMSVLNPHNIDEWVDIYVQRSGLNFSQVIFGNDAQRRGSRQLKGLLRNAFENLQEAQEALVTAARYEEEKGSVNTHEECLLEAQKACFEKVFLNLDRFSRSQMDRWIFMHTTLNNA